MNTLQLRFTTIVVDSRYGVVKTKIERLIPSHYSAPHYTAKPGEHFRSVSNFIDESWEQVAIVPGYVSYQEQDEWIDILS